MDIRRIAAIKEKEEVIGNRTKVKIVKNKVAPPFREAKFDIIYNEGVSLTGEIVDLGVEHGIVDKAGAWYAFQGERIGQGREAAKQFLKDHPEMREEIRSLILDLAGLDYISSAGVRSIFKARKALVARGGKVVVVNPKPQIQKVFDVVKAVPLDEIFSSVQEADAYLDAMQKKVLRGEDDD